MNESFWPKINKESGVPAYLQIVDYFVRRVKDGTYAPGLKVPSLNGMAGLLGLSRETVFKSYDHLCHQGLLHSRHGKGYYISNVHAQPKESILVVLSEINPNITTILSSMMSRLKEKVDVTIQFHNENLETLRNCITDGLAHYDWFCIFPHFNPVKVSDNNLISVLRRIPQNKLIVMDRFLPDLENCGMCYQHIANDIISSMEPLVTDFRRFNRLLSTPVYSALYGEEIERSLKLFCTRNHIPFEVCDVKRLQVFKGDVFFIYGCNLGQELVSLTTKIRQRGFTIGKDIGVICYDDFQINEILLDGLTTLMTDYEEMGREAAEMILHKQTRRTHCHFAVKRRHSF